MTSSTRRPLVSAILPVYNGESFVAKAIESVLAQTYPNIELIVIDDGSTDGTGSVVATFDDDRIIYVRQGNRGLPVARNAGADASSGEILAFIDADDEWLPEKIDRQMEVVKRGRVVYSDIEFWDQDSGETIGSYEYFDRFPQQRDKFSGRVVESVLAQNIVHPSTLLLTRDDFDRLDGFRPELRVCEDWDFALRAATEFELLRVEAQLARIRRRRDSLQSQSELLRRNGRLVVHEATERLKVGRRLPASTVGAAGLGYFTSRNMGLAAAHLGRAAVRQPLNATWWRWFAASLVWRPLDRVRRKR